MGILKEMLLNMNHKQFLTYMYLRMIDVHKENKNNDYMHIFKAFVESMPDYIKFEKPVSVENSIWLKCIDEKN